MKAGAGALSRLAEAVRYHTTTGEMIDLICRRRCQNAPGAVVGTSRFQALRFPVAPMIAGYQVDPTATRASLLATLTGMYRSW